MEKKNSLFKNLAFVFVITLFAKLMGFIREMVYGSQLGISSISDNFVMAQNIPVTLYAILTQAFRTTYIPNLYRIRKEKGNKAGEAYTGNYIVVVSIASLLTFILLFILAKPLTLLFAGGFSEDNIAQTVYLTRFIAVTVLFGGLIDVLNGYLQSSGYYNIGASLTIFSNIVFCGFLFLYPILGIKALILGSIISKAVELLIVAFASIIHKLKIQFNSWKYFAYTTEAMKNSVPVLLGSIINDLGSLIDKRFATQLISGTVSGLNYANKIELMVIQLFSATIGAVLFPELSKRSDDLPQFSNMVEKGIKYILIVMVPITMGIIIISSNFISVLFQRGAFDDVAVQLTSESLVFYAPAILFTVCYEFLSKACFALHDTKTPVFMSAGGMIINVVFNALLVNKFHHQGLAFATSLSMFIAFFGVYIVLRKKLVINKFGIWNTLWKVLVSSIIMTIIIFFEKKIGISNKYLSFLIYFASGVIVYYLVLILVRCEDIKELSKKALSRFRRK